MTLKREKFHTFDALRFFSFLIVFLSHIPNSSSLYSIRGDIGVYFFFVLSGFLITYILLFDKKMFLNFNFKNYMTRRILRIWPLYFLILFISFICVYLHSIYGSRATLDGYEPNWVFSCLFLENYMVIYHNCFSKAPIIPVLWSLCVEEHFYIIWGAILFFSKQKYIPYWIVSIIILATISRYFFNLNNLLFKDILTNFDYFMYGAIPAYLYLNFKEKTIFKIEKISFLNKIIITIICIVYILYTPYLEFNFKNLIEPTLLGLMFSCLIFFALPKKNKFKIENSNIFSKLGFYTYGLYMLHSIMISVVAIFLLKANFILTDFQYFLIVFFVSILLTIIISIICYHIIEKPFLKLKSRYN